MIRKNTKILLVQPVSTGQPHMGLMFVSAALKKGGYKNISFVAVNNELGTYKRSKKYFKDLLKQGQNIVGITATTATLKEAIKYSKSAKKSGAIVIMGGPGSTDFNKKIINKVPTVDYVINGESEGIIVKFFDKILNKKDFTKIPGISYRKKGKCASTGNFVLVADLDELPYADRSILEMETYHSPLSILTSRGCPYNCVFCFKSIHGKKWRNRSPKNVVDEIEYLIKTYNKDFLRTGKRISFSDDIFNLDVKRVKKIAKEVIKRKIDANLVFVNGFHVRTVDLEMFKLLNKAGCVEVWFGIDAGSGKILKNIGKGINLNMARKAVNLAKKGGIKKVGAHFIIGLPGETKETAKQALDFAKSLNVDVLGFNHANILPGTELWEWVMKNGKLLYKIKDFDYSNYKQLSGKPVFETKKFTKEERIKAYDDAVTYSDNLMRKKALNFKTFKHFFSQIRSWNDVKKAFYKIKKFLFEKDLRFK